MKKQSIAAADRKNHKQDFALNLIRAVAITMIMFDHSMRNDMGEKAIFLSRLLINSDAVLFFMVSGALLLPVKGSYSEFLRRRIMRVFIPYVIWTLIYTLLKYHFGLITEYNVAQEMRWSWLSYNMMAGWFIPTIMSLYLLMPLLSPWVERATRRNFHYVLVIWLLSGMMPFMITLFGVQDRYYLFQSFVGAFPYALIGYYIAHWRNRQPLMPSYVLPVADDSEPVSRKRRRTRRRKLTVLYTLLVLVSVVIPFAIRPCFHTVDFEKLCANEYGLPCIASGLLLFSLLIRVKSVGKVMDKVVTEVAKCSYGIYLSHVAFGAFVLPFCFPEIFDSTLLSFLCQFFVPLGFVMVVRRIPFVGRYLV